MFHPNSFTDFLGDQDCANIFKFQIKKVEELPHFDEMTLEMIVAYLGPMVGMPQKPSLFPYTPRDQPGNIENEVKSNALLPPFLQEKIPKRPID